MTVRPQPSVVSSHPRRVLLGLAGSAHPAPTLAVTLVTVLLCVGVGLRAGTTGVIGLAVFSGQLSIGWSNDVIDAGRDRGAGRKDKPVARGGVPRRVVAVSAGVALVVGVALSFVAAGVPAGVALLVLVAAGWSYNLGLKATVWSGAAYLVGFGALPAAPFLARAGHPWPPWWVPVAGALLGFGAHFANVLPDLRDDAAAGVRGLPQRVGARAGVVVMAAALGTASVVLAVGSGAVVFGTVVALVGVLGAAAAAVLASRRPDGPAAFRVTMALAVLDVVLLLVVA